MTLIACVTGAASGIGLAITKMLAELDYHVALVDIRESADVDKLIRSLKGNKHSYIKADIANSDARKTILAEIKERYETINLLVNNAGIAPEKRQDLLEVSEDSYDRIMNVNLKGPFFLTQLIANYMIELIENRKIEFAKIINISSISAYTASASRPEYCLSKAGVSMMTLLYAERLAQYGINVYEIRPGIIKTPMTACVHDKYDKLIFEDGILPIKRWGQPEDIAAAVKAIVSGSFEYSTGQVFDVDGGFHIRRL